MKKFILVTFLFASSLAAQVQIGKGVQIGGTGTGGATLPTSALVYGTSSTTSRAATTTDVTNLIQAQTGCTSAGNFWQPATGTCVAPASSGFPGGATNQVQFNNSGAFGADANFTWNSTTKVLGLPGTTRIEAGQSPDSFAKYNFNSYPTVTLDPSGTNLLETFLIMNYGADEIGHDNGVTTFLGTATGNTHNYGHIAAVVANTGHQGTGTVGELLGGEFNEGNYSTGTVTALHGIHVDLVNNGGGTVGDANGIQIDSPTGTFPATTDGMRILQQTRYNLYSEGSTSKNLFEGSITANGIVDSALTAGTSSICPNGTGGAFTTVGCAGSGSGISGLTSGYIPLAGSATTLTANSHLDDGITNAGIITSTVAIRAPIINKVVYADGYCTGGFNDTCLSAAITAAGNNSKIILSPRTYVFGSAISVSSLSNVWIQGSGAATIIQKDGTAFTCTSCTNFKVSDLNFTTTTTPTVVTAASLPTASPSTVVVIDRWATGKGYIPTSNDTDIVPTGSGGSCVSNCLSAAQSTEAFDTGLLIVGGSNVEVTGLTGSFYSIVFNDSSNINVHGNIVSGGKGFLGGIGFWKVNSGTAGNHNLVVADNIVNYAAFSGIVLAGADHAQVTGNVVAYNGESGVKTYQNTPEQSSFLSITGNTSSYNWYDGFDLSSTNPRASTFAAYSVASGNHSDHNRLTGYITDGLYWTFTGNQASLNGFTGMETAFCKSTITGNEATGNNTSNTGGHQLIVAGDVSCGGNTISGNHTDTGGHTGNGLFAGGTQVNTVFGNIETTGAETISTANHSWMNFDSTGQLTGSQLNLTSLQLNHAGSTLLTPESSAGGFTLTVPAVTGTLATGTGTNGYYGLWSGTHAIGNGHMDDGITNVGTITSTEPILAPSFQVGTGTPNCYITTPSSGVVKMGITSGAADCTLDVLNMAMGTTGLVSFGASTGLSGGAGIFYFGNGTVHDLTASVYAGGFVGSAFSSTGQVSINPLGAATSGANFNSSVLDYFASFWNGTAAAADGWQFANVLGTGTNPTSTLTLTHTGSPGTAAVAMPALNVAGSPVCTSSTGCAIAAGTRIWSCQPGLGDGLNAITAGTYLTTSCRNETGVTVTLTAIRCVADAGTSTCNATNSAGTGLLTGAITGTSTYANGTQSGTTTIASGGYIKITYVADGTSKQIGIDMAGTY